MKPQVYTLDPELDQEIAAVKLEASHIKIDHLTKEQITYARDYSAGT
jgi:adenosylhomocysteinase